jgi:hypothetical protein
VLPTHAYGKNTIKPSKFILDSYNVTIRQDRRKIIQKSNAEILEILFFSKKI